MHQTELTFQADFSSLTFRQNIGKLLKSGTLGDKTLHRWVERLQERFDEYCSVYPYGLWGPGLVPTREMSALTDLYLPIVEIHQAFHCLCRKALAISPSEALPLFNYARSWLDILPRLPEQLQINNPAKLLRQLLKEDAIRESLLFGTFLPRRHGGSFLRYPGQYDVLRKWLEDNRKRISTGLQCLDAACGSGECTYRLAAFLLEMGFSEDSLRVHGVSVEPLEVFAAAHAYFPHDLLKQISYRQWLEQHGATLWGRRCVTFAAGDITSQDTVSAEAYDIILCNGLLGGPMLSDSDLTKAIAALAAGLKKGGILMAADRFHCGWKKKTSFQQLTELFQEKGLTSIPSDEGIAVIREYRSGAAASHT
ncbi:CheR family methyltransferase [Geobacter sp. DSM 9736]|uniref:CheR family methyltransferase n=1 Tax=Geobacter sp. DSM 9736 TaxID=1277350 RepID=UPI000B5135A9|nr:CheR family methyltransferase [Geobacter sp. DSM 9736]SNB47631.1 MCP methyltransferase, CheR-type [Geobacter sp. DSM 9736]